MRRLTFLLYKDLLLLWRDKAGLMFLFVMPLVLVLVMTGIQKGAIDSTTTKSISLTILDDDKAEVGRTIVSELQAKNIFDVTIADSTATIETLQTSVNKGTHMIGVYIPSGTTEAMYNGLQDGIAKAFGADIDTTATEIPSTIKIYLDPTINSTFRTTLMCYMREAYNKMEKRFMFAAISQMMPIGSLNESDFQTIDIEEVTQTTNSLRGKANVTDHNVPAWTLFAIFFIIISLSSGIIMERQDGSFARLMTMPCSYTLYLLSKVLVYLLVCLLQFSLIMMMGKWLFPALDLPVFQTHGMLFYCFVVVVFSALAAIGYGLLISTFATTNQQASIFGAISVVLFSAIGGIWVPTFLMPKFLNSMSVIFPLNWGIEAFYDVVLRRDIAGIIPECATLLIFSVICFVIAIMAKGRKHC